MKRLLFLSSLAVASLGVAELINPAPVIIWNHTESVPRGLYLRAGRDISVGEIVVIEPGDTLRTFFTERLYLPENVPLMKQVTAVSDDQVCRQGDEIFINFMPVAVALKEDSSGRSLPDWQGCFILSEQEIFLLGSHEHSLDGRYFGPVSREHVLGTYQMIWRVKG